MGVSAYWMIVVAIIVCGVILPQRGQKKKTYVIIIAAVHTFVCGFRYIHLVGDLMKYHHTFNTLMDVGYFSSNAFHDGRNFLFYWIMKAVADLTGGNFQVLLMLLAIITEVIIAVLIFRYSPQPWLSYLVWDCMAFFITYGICAIKQGLAMAILMCSFMCIIEKNPKRFCVFTVIAGLIHMPAFCFLPAYWLARRRVNKNNILLYVLAGTVVFLLRTPIVNVISLIYYEDESFMLTSAGLGGRFLLIVLLLLCGLLLKGFQEKNFECLFNLIMIAAIFQMFSGFNNIFTRLADYYLQFVVLYIPMLFYKADDEVELNATYMRPTLFLTGQSKILLPVLAAVVLIWYYRRTCLSVPAANSVDNYVNFRFMWDVTNSSLW